MLGTFPLRHESASQPSGCLDKHPKQAALLRLEPHIHAIWTVQAQRRSRVHLDTWVSTGSRAGPAAHLDLMGMLVPDKQPSKSSLLTSDLKSWSHLVNAIKAEKSQLPLGRIHMDTLQPLPQPTTSSCSIGKAPTCAEALLHSVTHARTLRIGRSARVCMIICWNHLSSCARCQNDENMCVCGPRYPIIPPSPFARKQLLDFSDFFHFDNATTSIRCKLNHSHLSDLDLHLSENRARITGEIAETRLENKSRATGYPFSRLGETFALTWTLSYPIVSATPTKPFELLSFWAGSAACACCFAWAAAASCCHAASLLRLPHAAFMDCGFSLPNAPAKCPAACSLSLLRRAPRTSRPNPRSQPAPPRVFHPCVATHTHSPLCAGQFALVTR